jgi:hypothetical protein
MLESIRFAVSQMIAASLAEDPLVTVAALGPKGVQAGRFMSEARGTDIYLLLPSTSEFVQALGHGKRVVVTTPAWQASGPARCLATSDAPPDLALLHHPDYRWCTLAVVRGSHFEKFHPQGWGTLESYDLDWKADTE